MRPRNEIARNPRVKMLPDSLGIDACEIRTHEGVVQVIFSADDEGWEHVSVSPKGSKRECVQPCPTWRQMCEVKDVFWSKEEGVVQFHPPEKHYLHGPTYDTNILHLWKPTDDDWAKLGWD